MLNLDGAADVPERRPSPVDPDAFAAVMLEEGQTALVWDDTLHAYVRATRAPSPAFAMRRLGVWPTTFHAIMPFALAACTGGLPQ